MAYGLPTRGQADWDDELNNSLESLRADVQTALADASTARSTAIHASNVALAGALGATLSLTAVFDGESWPARPLDDETAVIFWVDPTGEGGVPPDAVDGQDIVIAKVT